MTTKWFAVCYVPIIPLQSLRVGNANQSKNFVVYRSTRYNIYSQGTPNLKQVFCIYAWLGAVALSLYFVALLDRFALAPQLQSLASIPVLTLLFLPWILRRRARKYMLSSVRARSNFQQTPNANEFNVLVQAGDQGWDSERTQKELAQVMTQNKPK